MFQMLGSGLFWQALKQTEALVAQILGQNLYQETSPKQVSVGFFVSVRQNINILYFLKATVNSLLSGLVDCYVTYCG